MQALSKLIELPASFGNCIHAICKLVELHKMLICIKMLHFGFDLLRTLGLVELHLCS